jgi:hypothetical protein
VHIYAPVVAHQTEKHAGRDQRIARIQVKENLPELRTDRRTRSEVLIPGHKKLGFEGIAISSGLYTKAMMGQKRGDMKKRDSGWITTLRRVSVVPRKH